MSLYVYVAGPMSVGDKTKNIRDGVQAADVLLKMGYIPFCPMLDHFWSLMFPGTPYETWLAWDFAWIDRCDVLLRLPGQSPGADREIAHAQSKGIPVVYSVSELIEAEVEIQRRRDLPA